MEVALRRRVGMRGLGCSTYPSSTTVEQAIECAFLPWSENCRALKRIAVAECNAQVIPLPPTIKPPVIDINPSSPTYGQATVNGAVVSTPEQTADLIAQQIADAEAARKEQVGGVMTDTAARTCQQLQANCGPFTSANADCTECAFDPSRPMFLLLAFGAVALLVAKPWK